VTDAADTSPGVHPARSRLATDELALRLADDGWSVRVVDLVEASDKPAILTAFAQALSFPGWVGRNWDALEDALRDLSWWPATDPGRVVIVRGAGRDSTGTERDRATLRSILESAADRWARTPSPLVVLLRR
jgi:hypothetical protein